MNLKSVCVFCGASTGSQPIYAEAAVLLGRTLAERGLRLIYGGGAVGLMGIVADAALAAGGEV
ncbi:MAG TPA: TIGR00730 family Rossman fold protein, partial [Pseudomonas sp.]|nr:TIGR00730 family Rossman fold protein [Pseudomonas sp.]